MNGSSPHLPESWLSHLGGADASGWLTAFQSNAERAVSNLLWNRFYFGPLNLTERGQLLATWLDAFGNSENFAQRLDSAFVVWIDANWGRFEQPAVSMVSAWTCLASVIEFSARLPKARLAGAAAALRARFPLRERFLGSFSTAPAADPLGFYLAVVAEFQDDRSLVGLWQRFCDLPDGVPFYHARYAILGLRRLKAASAWENGSLRAEVVLGLLRLATAFDRLVRERGLSEQLAKSTFRRVAVQLAAAYPGSPGWSECGLARALEMRERPQRWVLDSIGPLAIAVKQEQAKANRPHTRPRPSIQPDPDWTVSAQRLAEALRTGHLEMLPQAMQLIAEQRQYYEATGDSYALVHSLRNFAVRIVRHQPAMALRWAEEAIAVAPNDPWSWTNIKDVLLKQKNLPLALRFAWVAWKRFPENVVARTGLAEVLKVAGCHPEAEEVYRQTIERFPEDIHACIGLAEVLKATERYSEAEEVYRQTIERFPENIHARPGLADTLRRARRWADAETAFRESITAGYVGSPTFVGLAYLLLRKGEAGRTEALSLLDEALRLNRRDEYVLALKQKLQPAQASDIAGIADEWESVADEFFAAPEVIEEDVTEADDGAGAAEIDFGDLQFDEPPRAAQPLTPDSPQAPTKPLDATAPAKPLPVSNVFEVSALIAEANFFRLWASHCVETEALSHREKAAALLTKADALSPQDAQIAAEKTALEWSRGNHEQASQTLFTQLGKHPATAPLLVLKARLDREVARKEQRRLSEATLADMLRVPNRLRDIAPALTPVFHLQKGLAALALFDGAVRIDTAANAFTNFRRTIAHWAAEEKVDREASRDRRTKETPRFHEWLQTIMNRRIFSTLPNPESVRVDDVPAIEQSLADQPFIFDEIEDTIVDRIAFAGV